MPAAVAPSFQLFDIDPANTNDELADAIVLQNGRLLFIGSQFSSTGDILMRQFSLAGSATTALQRVNTTTFDAQDDAKVVQLANGNIVVIWTDESETAPDFSGQTVRMQIFGAAGNRIGGEITVPTTTGDDQQAETVIALKDGRFAVFWEDSSASSSAPATKFRIYNANGTAAGGERTVASGIAISETEGYAASHGTDGLIVAGVNRVGFADQIVVQRYSSTGAASGGPIALSGTGDFTDAKIARLTNGTYVVTWTDESQTPPFNKGPVVNAQIINWNGDKVGGSFTVTGDIFSEHSQSEITALSDGRFVVSWEAFPDNNFTAYKHVMRVFNADGTPDSAVVTVYDNSVANAGIRNFAHLRSVSELPDGRLIYTFNALEPDGTFTAATRIVDPRDALNITLGEGSNSYVGTGFADIIRGRGGNDVIDGLGGSDTLAGDSGNDRLGGGSGNDRLDGGLGNDVLAGDAGNDLIAAGAGADRLIGGAGRDTLAGGAADGAADVFVFQNVADSRAGAATRDVIRDFVSGRDDIDLSAMDANTGRAGNQAFSFSGTAARANSVWLVDTGADMVVRGDINGDRIADFEVQVAAINLIRSGDFLL